MQLAHTWWQLLLNYSGMMRTTVQLQAHDVYNCPITSAWHVQLSNYKCMTCATVQLRLKSGLLMTNQICEFRYSYDYKHYNIATHEQYMMCSLEPSVGQCINQQSTHISVWRQPTVSRKSVDALVDTDFSQDLQTNTFNNRTIAVITLQTCMFIAW